MFKNLCIYSLITLGTFVNSAKATTIKTSTAPTDTSKPYTEEWYKDITRSLSQQEYYINPVENSSMYSCPNRMQNMRAYFAPQCMRLENRVDTLDQCWSLQLSLVGIYANQKQLKDLSSKPKEMVRNNTLEFQYPSITEQYINTSQGIRQNFIIQKAPANTKTIEVKLKTSGLTPKQVSETEIQFLDDQQKKMSYQSLYVYDASGKQLPAYFVLKEHHLSIIAKVSHATYPITIDPLSSSVNWTTEINQNSAWYGMYTSSAGDVNGDGYSDVIVGAQTYDNGNSDEGGAWLYLGSSTGLSTTASWQKEGNQDGARYGFPVNTAGDVNGDGYSDVIVGAYYYDNGQVDEGAAFVYHGSSSGLSNTINWQGEINQAAAYVGYQASTAGDVNGDGYSDVIIGGHYYDNGQSEEGAVWVFHGSASGLSTTPNWSAEGGQNTAYFGSAAGPAGDVNGDGYSDVIVGAYAYDNGNSNEGAVYVFHGSGSGLSGTASFSKEIDQTDAYFGSNISFAGDVNGDGYSDVIVGASGYDNGQADEGAVFVFHGSASGLSTAIAKQLEINQAGASYSNGACAGDVNSDGYSDVIIGGHLYDNGQSNEGGVWVHLGSSTGVTTASYWNMEMNQVDGYFGTSVRSAGDVNGDGFSDVMIGAYGFDNGQAEEGKAWVFHGSADGLSTSSSWSDEGSQTSGYFAFSVDGAGDVNGDGYSDVLVGALYYDNGQTDEGKVWAYHGSATGLSASSAWTVEGNQTNAYMGYRARAAGDVNGDGYGDVIVPLQGYDNGQTDEGMVHLYYGSASGLSTTIAWQVESNQASATLSGGVGIGDVNGDGYADIAMGAGGYDNGQTDEGVVWVFHGSATGPAASPDWTKEVDQAGATFSAVGPAGDVNGDGYSDLMAVAFYFDNGHTDEGKIMVFHGSSSGLSSSEAWSFEGNQNTPYLGYTNAFGSIGDVNGDGYGDVIVGAIQYANGHTNEGKAWVFHGSASGLSGSAAWSVEGNATSAYLGCSGGAGDVNGDGYDDVIVAAYHITVDQDREGKVWVYHGSESGLSGTSSWAIEGNQNVAVLGSTAVTGVGDVNGDGYSDVIVGSSYYDNGHTDEGKAWVYQGNKGGGLRRNLRLFNTGTTDIITRSNISSTQFDIGLFAKHFLGKSKAKLVWEIKPNGTPFSSASPITNSTAFTDEQSTYTDVGLTGTQLTQTVDKDGKQSKIRARIKYDPVTALNGQVYSPWIYPKHDISGNYGGALPIDLISFDGACNKNEVNLTWQTASEQNNAFFTIERSLDTKNWEIIGTKDGAGNSNEILSYNFTDSKPLEQGYYRLKQTDINGDFEYSKLIFVYCKPEKQDPYLFPNPNNGIFQIIYTQTGGVLEVYDASGRLLQQSTSDQDKSIVDLQSLSTGLYFIHLWQNEKKFVFKIVMD